MYARLECSVDVNSVFKVIIEKDKHNIEGMKKKITSLITVKFRD